MVLVNCICISKLTFINFTFTHFTYRFGNENQMASLFGLMIALVSVTQDSNDTLQSICCGQTRIVFLNKDPIILVGVSQSSEPNDQIKKQLT